MRIRLLPMLLFLILPYSLKGQDQFATSHATTPPVDARFQIIQSDLAARWTFKLDRISGDVYQYVVSADGDSHWQKMRVLSPSAGTTGTSGKPHFQIFTSGLAAKFTFLLDTVTGDTWQLTMLEADPNAALHGLAEDENVWERMN